MIRVLVVDDSFFFRTVIKDMLRADPGIEVVGTASDGIEAISEISRLSPDVVTLDIEMPRMNGIETLGEIARLDKKPKVMMLSTLTSKDAELTYQALKLGADDFMLKPRDIQKVKGIGKELVAKVKNLVKLPTFDSLKRTVSEEPAEHVVVIGSSAGGPPMLDSLVSSLKPGIPAAFVITQHMPEKFTASLAERLNRISQIPVSETKNGEILKKGHVLISKGNYHTIIGQFVDKPGRIHGKIIHSKASPVHAVRPAIDKTFSSAAHVFGADTLAIILSGMGNDCGEGAAAVKKAGGRTLVCREEDCLVYGMIRSALNHNAVDRVVPFVSMGSIIRKVVDEMESR